MLKYGIVQGRLTPLRGTFIQEFPQNWRQEFKRAKKLGVSHIEWIEGARGGNIGDFLEIDTTDLEVPISGICLDWMVDVRHLSSDDALHDAMTLMLTFDEARNRGIKRIVMPFLENASLNIARQLDRDLYDRAINTINDLHAEFPEIRISVETDLPPDGVVDLLLRTQETRITFDMGNLIKHGHDLNAHLDAYIDSIDNVHIKDCNVKGTTVQLGTGDTDLTVIRRLAKAPNVEYLTFQTARAPGDEEETFRHNVRTIEEVLNG